MHQTTFEGIEPDPECPSSPDGTHCWHLKNKKQWRWPPSSPKWVCCWCGATKGKEHGPHKPNPWEPRKRWESVDTPTRYGKEQSQETDDTVVVYESD